MPEGHTIHRLAADHQRDFVAEKLAVSSPQGRFEKEAAKLTGRKIESVSAYGKHLFYRWQRGAILHIHLGLYGKFRTHNVPVPPPRGQVRLRVVGQKKAFDLNGPNRCELISEQQFQAIVDRLGVDPLRPNADPDPAWERIRNSRAAIGTLLLDQSVFAGVGNVYRSEVLFLLGIHPKRLGKELTRGQFDELWQKLVELLSIGKRYNRIITADPKEIGKPRSRMSQEERLLVYKHENCSRCDGANDWFELGARKAYACPRCQS